MAKREITLSKKEAEFVQRMTLDLRSMIHDIIQATPLPNVASDALMRYNDQLKQFYETIEEQLYTLQQKGKK